MEPREGLTIERGASVTKKRGIFGMSLCISALMIVVIAICTGVIAFTVIGRSAKGKQENFRSSRPASGFSAVRTHMPSNVLTVPSKDGDDIKIVVPEANETPDGIDGSEPISLIGVGAWLI